MPKIDKQTERLVWITDRLKRNVRFNRNQAAEELDVVIKTISNDLECLQIDYGWETSFDKAKNSYVLEQEGRPVLETGISSGEWLSLHTAARVCRARGLGDIAGSVEQVAARYETRVTAETEATRAEEAEVLMILPGLTQRGEIPYLTELLEATRYGYWVRIKYRNVEGMESERRIDPYRILVVGSTAYLFAWCHSRNGFRQFRTDRILELMPSQEPFSPRKAESTVNAFVDRQLGPWGDGAPTRIRIRFSTWLAKWVRGQRWHASQTDHEQADGTLEIELTVSGTRQVLWRVLSYGSEAEILEPPELRAKMLETSRAIASLYAGD